MRTTRSTRRAFTLVELIATMTVVAVMGSVVSVMIGSSVNGYTRAATTAQLNSELSIALDRIGQLLRDIPQKVSGPPDITSITATSITWDTDWTLTLSGSQLMLTENGGPASVLLSDVTSFSIAAFDESNAALAANLSGSACDAVQRLTVNITQTRSGVIETLRSRVFIRSLMAELED